jgi:hypothetical protein
VVKVGRRYKLRLRTIIVHLKDHESGLSERLLTGELSAVALVAMREEQMQSERRTQKAEVMRRRRLDSCVTTAQGTLSTRYTHTLSFWPCAMRPLWHADTHNHTSLSG